MNQNHEYALLGGMNRAKVGRYIGGISASISALIVFLLLAAVDMANALGIPASLPPSVLSLVSAATIWAVLYWYFDRYAWRWSTLARWLKVPDLAGGWECEGRGLNPDGTTKHAWSGKVTIAQSWDRIRVRLKTAQSGSNSLSAALMHDPIDGYVLLYHYLNDPRLDEPELRSHRGFAELTFAKDLETAEGQYFNGHGRNTFGMMKLKRLGRT
jgi:hypothetical protein